MGGGKAETDGQHDGVAVGDDGDFHRLFGVMPVGHVHIVGQGRARQTRADIAHVDDLMRHTEAFGGGGGEFDFLHVALAVVEGQKRMQVAFLRHDVGKGNGIQSA